ncbi:MAG: ribosomal L7Ae/L30e/S12e/Gadd45 family protein [Longimicrobiales bacterium]
MSPASKVYGLLGLARRAGGAVPGVEAVRQSVREGRARLVVLATDASAAQLEKVERTLAGRPAPRVNFGDRSGLGAALGLAPVSAVAVTSTALAGQILAEMDHVSEVALTAVEG